MPKSGFDYQDDVLSCEKLKLTEIAERFSTPCYVYSAGAILANYRAYDDGLKAIPHAIHYSVKANASLAILSLLARAGAGFDIVSGGELFRVIGAGADPRKVVYSGVGKTEEEISYALKSGIGSFNCESESELCLLNEIAGRLGLKPVVAIRVNPDISAESHPYISTGLKDHKFGIAIDKAEQLYKNRGAFPRLNFEGISCHIGSQIFDTSVFFEALEKVAGLTERLRGAGLAIQHLDLGGGLGIAYAPSDNASSIAEFAGALSRALQGMDLRLMIEPGRSIVGPAGVLLTKVLYRKLAEKKEFLIVDAAMNDLIRPALYQSHHEIVPLERKERKTVLADVVGPICETGDFLARGRRMPAVEPGEILAIRTAGAYGFVLSSNYNARPRPAEVLIEDGHARLIRKREIYEDLVRGEAAV